jgi:hypothetical protein
MALIENTLRGNSIRAAAEAMGRAVAITADELITAKSGLLGRWGNRVERYPLSALRDVQLLPNPAAALLALQFEGRPSVTLMFGLHAQSDLERLLALLQGQLEARANP